MREKPQKAVAICEVCGREFTYLRVAYKIRKCCSRECAVKYSRRTFSRIPGRTG